MARKTESDILRYAAHILEEFGWNQEFYAKDACGQRVYWSNKSAVSFCVLGAIGRARDDLLSDQERTLDEYSGLDLPESYLLDLDDHKLWRFGRIVKIGAVAWNDETGRTKEEVIALLRETADRIETKSIVKEEEEVVLV